MVKQLGHMLLYTFSAKKAEDELIAISANNNSNYGYNGVDQLTGQTVYFLPWPLFMGTPGALQPLIDDLESETYETFERDLVKYERYEEALYRALCHIHSHEAQTHPRIEVVVAGAGGVLFDGPYEHGNDLQKLICTSRRT